MKGTLACLLFWVAKTEFIYCLGVQLREGKRGKRRNRIAGVHSAQRRGKSHESGRKQRNKGREIIKGAGEQI